MKKWIVTISAALSTLDLFWKDRIEKRPDSAKEEEMSRGEDPDSQGSQLRFRPGDAER